MPEVQKPSTMKEHGSCSKAAIAKVPSISHRRPKINQKHRSFCSTWTPSVILALAQMVSFLLLMLLLVDQATAVGVGSGDSAHLIGRKCFGLRNGGILEYTGLSTKTPYSFLLPTIKKSGRANAETQDRCEPLMFMMLGRHGTRYPGNEDVLVAAKLLPVLINATLTAHEKSKKGTLSPDTLSDFRQWRLPFPMGADDQIHPIGVEEWHILAEIYKAKFPQFLDKQTAEPEIKFVSSYKNRTIASAEAFADGLFGDAGQVISIEDKTKILRFYKYCPRWRDEVDENPGRSLLEARAFEKSCPFQDMLDRVTAKLGLDRRLSPLDIEILYGECQMETAHCPCCKSFYPSSQAEQQMLDETNGLHHLDSETCRQCTMPTPWCKIFSEDDLKVLEFWDDLKKYWQDGFGFSLNYEQSCVLVRELVDQLTRKLDTLPSPPKSLLYFMHSGGLAKLLARLGLFKDDRPLTAQDFHSSGRRKWRTSKFLPFSANLIFAHYRCGENLETYTYMNGEEIDVPLFRQSGGFLQALQPIAAKCNFDRLCASTPTSRMAPVAAPPPAAAAAAPQPPRRDNRASSESQRVRSRIIIQENGPTSANSARGAPEGPERAKGTPNDIRQMQEILRPLQRANRNNQQRPAEERSDGAAGTGAPRSDDRRSAGSSGNSGRSAGSPCTDNDRKADPPTTDAVASPQQVQAPLLPVSSRDGSSSGGGGGGTGGTQHQPGGSGGRDGEVAFFRDDNKRSADHALAKDVEGDKDKKAAPAGVENRKRSIDDIFGGAVERLPSVDGQTEGGLSPSLRIRRRTLDGSLLIGSQELKGSNDGD